MSVYENILTGAYMFVRDAAAREQRIRETAELVGLTPQMDELAKNLPHGHQRLLSIAIAFASRPKLAVPRRATDGVERQPRSPTRWT